jgi:hypothetical protein
MSDQNWLFVYFACTAIIAILLGIAGTFIIEWAMNRFWDRD